MNGTGINATFNVTTNSGANGNALVAYIINGTIYWSWHIWVTDQNPATDSRYQKRINSVTIMDRNLGARNATKGDIGSFGLYFQPGKKDPYPGAVELDNANDKVPIYNINNQVLGYETTGIVREIAPSTINMVNAIQNPMTYYMGNYGKSTWYGQLAEERRGLWNDTYKTDYDPCPAGWKVMKVETISSLPYQNIYASNYAYDYGSETGFFPVAGSSTSTYTLALAGRAVYGIVSNAQTNGGYILRNNHVPSSTIGNNSAAAVSIRCVKE